MVPKPGSSCGASSTARDSEKRPTSEFVSESSTGSSNASVSSATGRRESIELCKESDTRQGFPDSVEQGEIEAAEIEAAEIEALAGCGCFPLRLRSKFTDPSLRHQGSKAKTVAHYRSIGDLTDTFYEEKDPGRRPYDLPSYGSGGAHRSVRASQRHFREWL